MTLPDSYSFTRYLSAKKSVDDRALNRHVWAELARTLPPASQDHPLHVLEVGAGIGTMVERTLEWDLLRHAEYAAIDSQAENILTARERLEGWSRSLGMYSHSSAWELWLEGRQHRLEVSLEAIDLYEFIARDEPAQRWDLLIAHAFLDLINVPSILPDLLSLLAPGSLFYFTLNFDGLTLLEPAIDAGLDEAIQALYHSTMDARRVNGRPSGDSRTGRHLFSHVTSAGAQVLAAGASDWVVHPLQGSYPEDEAYFLHFIIHTIDQALAGHPDLDAGRLRSWVVERHAQVERGELVYIAHQLDLLGRTGSANPG